MRLLVVADLHYSLPQYDWVMSVASDYDVVIIAGDQLDLSSIVDASAQIVVIGKYLARLREKTRLIICSGNHDLDARSAEGEKIARWIRDVPGVATDGQARGDEREPCRHEEERGGCHDEEPDVDDVGQAGARHPEQEDHVAHDVER